MPEGQVLRFRAADAADSISMAFSSLLGVQLRRPVEIRRPALRADDTAQLVFPAERQPFAMRLTNGTRCGARPSAACARCAACSCFRRIATAQSPAGSCRRTRPTPSPSASRSAKRWCRSEPPRNRIRRGAQAHRRRHRRGRVARAGQLAGEAGQQDDRRRLQPEASRTSTSRPIPGQGQTASASARTARCVTYIELPASYRSALIARAEDHVRPRHLRAPQAAGRQDQVQASSAPLDIELRVATIPTAGGVEDIVMRILAAARADPARQARASTRKQLLAVKQPISSALRPVLRRAARPARARPPRCTRCCGYLNTPERKIWTAEDPVEITQPGLRQVQVNPKIGWTFAAAHARVPARRSGHHHGRRDARQGDRRDRHRGLAHRPPGVLHPAHQQRAGDRHPPARHGHGPVQLRRRAARRAGAAPGAQAVSRLQGGVRAERGAELEELASRVRRVLPPRHMLYRAKGCVRCDRTGYRVAWRCTSCSWPTPRSSA